MIRKEALAEAWLQARMAIGRAFWIYPMLAILLALVAAGNISRLGYTTSATLGGLMTTGGPVGARELVDTVASMSMTIATFVFSVTIVALQVAASQYSPRVPRQFIRDRATQAVLAIFIFTFVYSLATLRSIDATDDFVPQFAVTVSFLCALVSVGAFVWFIHHIVHAIRIERILRGLEAKSIATARRSFAAGHEDCDYQGEVPDGAIVLRARRSVVLQSVGHERLCRIARRTGLTICVARRIGMQVVEGAPLVFAWRGDGAAGGELSPRDERAIRHAIRTGSERSIQFDCEFGLKQMVDIALRAVSTAINDPTTARAAIRSAEAVLAHLAGCKLGDRVMEDDAGAALVIVPGADFEDYLDRVVTPLRQTCPADLAVMTRLCVMLEQVGRAGVHDDERRRAVARQLELVTRAVRQASHETADVRRIARAAHDVQNALAGKPPRLA